MLNPRDVCYREIRERVGDDAWAARFVLLLALNHLDLEGVNAVLQGVLDAADTDPGWSGVGPATSVYYKLLLEERYRTP